MKAKSILLLGSVISIILVLLWLFKVVEEPIAALGSAVLTFISYLLASNSTQNQSANKTDKVNKIIQNHSGKGDNIGRDKRNDNRR